MRAVAEKPHAAVVDKFNTYRNPQRHRADQDLHAIARHLETFLQEWRFECSRSWSSKVIDFGTNRKRVCDFLLVRYSNLGLILHRFREFVLITPPLFHPSTLILGCSRWKKKKKKFYFAEQIKITKQMEQIADIWVSSARAYTWNYFNVFQPMWSRYLSVTCSMSYHSMA